MAILEVCYPFHLCQSAREGLHVSKLLSAVLRSSGHKSGRWLPRQGLLHPVRSSHVEEGLP